MARPNVLDAAVISQLANIKHNKLYVKRAVLVSRHRLLLAPPLDLKGRRGKGQNTNTDTLQNL